MRRNETRCLIEHSKSRRDGIPKTHNPSGQLRISFPRLFPLHVSQSRKRGRKDRQINIPDAVRIILPPSSPLPLAASAFIIAAEAYFIARKTLSAFTRMVLMKSSPGDWRVEVIFAMPA